MMILILLLLVVVVGITLSVGGSLVEWGQLIGGMLLGYYALSCRCRRLVNVLLFGTTNRIYGHQSQLVKNSKSVPSHARKKVESACDIPVVRDAEGKLCLSLSEEQFEDWLKNNPDLKEASD